jgi:hypothetical protein
MELTIKVNKTDITSVINALQRHGFNITFFEDRGDAEDDLRDRYDSFMNYLNI